MLRDEEFGRLAYRLVDEVHTTPINYAVEDGSPPFRTAEGNKFLAVVMGSDVAFEIDRYGEGWARSVVVRGPARLLLEDEASRRKCSAAAMGADAETQRRRNRAGGGLRPCLRAVSPVAPHRRPHASSASRVIS
jgi:nitroimidazol reductase NimA-like FMN-containing flavoprotein (pyridoxamine 5'-phosphate oxidase superfamily)